MVVYYVVGVVAITWLVLVNLLSYCMNENSYLARKIGFHGALTVSNRAKGVRKDQRPEQFFAWDLLDPKSLVRVTRSEKCNACEIVTPVKS